MFAPAQRGFPVDQVEFLALVAQSLNLGLGGGGWLGGRKGAAAAPAAPPLCARWRWPRILLEYQP